MKNEINAERLQRLVEHAATDSSPIVTSDRVKAFCTQKGIDWGDQDKGRKGRLLEEADHEACKQGRLQKWKRVGAPNAPIGWSLADAISLRAAARWAAEHGWGRVD